jgi:hypothetical protein
MARLSKPRGCLLAAATGMSLALLLPAQAQFWDWGGRPQRQNRDFNPFGGWFSPSPRYDGPRRYDNPRYYDRDAPVDHSRAPGPSAKKPEATTSVVVMGDANADWLAFGLEEAFSENPEIGIVRKHRTDSGLIRYDGRRDSEWAQVAREIVAAEKPKFVVMMVGNNDRQQIRERAAPAARPGAPAKPNAQPPTSAAPPAPAQPDPEQQTPEEPAAAEPAATPEPTRAAPTGPFEFRSEKWEAAYIRRVDATIAALKSSGAPVIWVGLPSQRGSRGNSDSSYLNEIYRSRAEKAGIVYVDIWDGFVDESGRFSPHGPDYEGQTRRLRTGDGIYFTKFGARKLAHYVEREIHRHLSHRGLPVALPVPADPGTQAPNAGGPAQRPLAGPVVPLTASKASAEELIGGSRGARAPAGDATATRVLTKGEPIAAPSGRADDFSWPRGAAVNAEPAAADQEPPAPPPPAAAAPEAPRKGRQRGPTTDAKADQAGGTEPAAERRPAQRRRTGHSNAPRPPWWFPNVFR